MVALQDICVFADLRFAGDGKHSRHPDFPVVRPIKECRICDIKLFYAAYVTGFNRRCAKLGRPADSHAELIL
jgi:hypothetical protein